MSAPASDRPDKLIHMANQIADFFRAYPHEKAVAGVAEHIRLFWDPRMRSGILRHHAAGGEGLDPIVAEAMGRLAARSTPDRAA